MQCFRVFIPYSFSTEIFWASIINQKEKGETNPNGQNGFHCVGPIAKSIKDPDTCAAESTSDANQAFQI